MSWATHGFVNFVSLDEFIYLFIYNIRQKTGCKCIKFKGHLHEMLGNRFIQEVQF